MTNILISYKDNPSFSLYTTSLGRSDHILDRKNWLGFDDLGREKTYTNSPGVTHILIKNCTLNEFMSAKASEEIKFRIVDDNELTTIKPTFGPLILKLDINALSKPIFYKLNNTHNEETMLERSKHLQDLTFKLDDAISRQKEATTIDGHEILLSVLAFKIYQINLEFGREDLARAYLKEHFRLEKIEQKNAEERDRLKFLSLCEKIREALNEYTEMRSHSFGLLFNSIKDKRLQQVGLIINTIEQLKSQADHKQALLTLQGVLSFVKQQVDEEYSPLIREFGLIRSRSFLGELIDKLLKNNSDKSTDTLEFKLKY